MPKIPWRLVPRTYVGIDPGTNGGLACLHSSGKIEATPMPETEREIWEWFKYVRDLPGEKFGVIEKVGGYIGDERKANGSSMFKFGHGYGGLRMALHASEIQFEAITPQVWQRALNVSKSGKSDGEWKGSLRGLAQQLFPSFPLWDQPRTKTKQLAISDALLIATICKRRFGVA